MDNVSEKLKSVVAFIRTKTDFVPELALVLGTGLGGLAEDVKKEAVVNFKEIPGFPVSTVDGHRGRFIFGTVCGKKVAVIDGRVHCYEGFDVRDAVLPTRVCKMLGADTIIITNAAGGLDLSYEVGDIMVISDHISLFFPSPLMGPNIDFLGTRFPNMTEVYDRELRAKFIKCAERLGTPLQKGVYVQVTGPAYETPAEIAFLRLIGGCAVGMSTVCEAIAARHAGMRVFGVSLITDVPGKDAVPLSHEEVQRVGREASGKLSAVMREFIKEI